MNKDLQLRAVRLLRESEEQNLKIRGFLEEAGNDLDPEEFLSRREMDLMMWAVSSSIEADRGPLLDPGLRPHELERLEDKLNRKWRR